MEGGGGKEAEMENNNTISPLVAARGNMPWILSVRCVETHIQALLLHPGAQAVHVPGGDLHVGGVAVRGLRHVGGVLVQDGWLRLLGLLCLLHRRWEV